MWILSWALACQKAEDLVLWEREPGERLGLSLEGCDPLDEGRCHLPWPSHSYMATDSSSVTGLRLAVDPAAGDYDDDASYLNLATGFSRASTLAVSFSQRLDPESLGALRLYQVQPDSEAYLEEIPLWYEHLASGSDLTPRDLIMGYPESVLEPDTDYMAVVTTELRAEGALEVSRGTLLALGELSPETQADADLQGHHAPHRAFLDALGIPKEEVLQVWGFTTRDAEQPIQRVRHAMETSRASVEAWEDLEVEITAVAEDSDENLLLVIRGLIHGLPDYLDEEDLIVLDSAGMPQAVGTRSAEFRVTIPAGDGDYPVTLYGHGSGGDVTDSSFDEQVAAFGLSKVNMRWLGWNGDDLVYLFANCGRYLSTSHWSTSALIQSLANTRAIQEAIRGPLADILSADSLMGEPNLAAGRRPDSSTLMWLGGSHGGVMGAVYLGAEEELRHAVLNVPGANWSAMIPRSLYYEMAMGSIMEATYGTELDAWLVLLMAQTAWDEVEGTLWGEEILDAGDVALMQMSMDDPIMPNLSTYLLASSLEATLLTPELEDPGMLARSEGPLRGQTALQQFRVPVEDEFDIHGFASRSTVAGEAALAQIEHFVKSSLAGEAEILFPEACEGLTADGACDFSDAWVP